MKYLIGFHEGSCFFHPIVFGDEIVHAEAAKALPPGSTVVGAGFFRLAGGNFETFGKADSLGGARPSSDDSLLLKLFIAGGLSGLALSNHLALLEIQESGSFRLGR